MDVLAHMLPDAEAALRLEAAVIDLLGLGNLTNRVRGWRSVQFGRQTVDQLIGYYAAKPVEVTEKALLIRINRMYRHGMPADELYEATRGVWRLGERRTQAEYALAVFEGVVREVYQIGAWSPAGTLSYAYRPLEEVRVLGRWEFSGPIADAEVRDRYLLRSVIAYFKAGQQNPVVYVNV